jgi:hypothetical protein
MIQMTNLIKSNIKVILIGRNAANAEQVIVYGYIRNAPNARKRKVRPTMDKYIGNIKENPELIGEEGSD